jgi:hypothetical protein
MQETNAVERSGDSSRCQRNHASGCSHYDAMLVGNKLTREELASENTGGYSSHKPIPHLPSCRS